MCSCAPRPEFITVECLTAGKFHGIVSFGYAPVSVFDSLNRLPGFSATATVYPLPFASLFVALVATSLLFILRFKTLYIRYPDILHHSTFRLSFQESTLKLPRTYGVELVHSRGDDIHSVQHELLV